MKKRKISLGKKSNNSSDISTFSWIAIVGIGFLVGILTTFFGMSLWSGFELVFYVTIYTTTGFVASWAIVEVYAGYITNKKRGKTGIATSSRLLGAVALTVLLLISTFSSGALGSILFPTPPPEEYQKGYTKILLYDQNNAEWVNGTIHLFFWNHTNYHNATTDTIIEIPELSYGYITPNGSYSNFTIGIYARDDITNPYTTIYYVNPITPITKIDFNLVAINGTYGTYGIENITDGHNILTFSLQIVSPFDTNTTFGDSQIYPYGFIPNDSYMDNYSDNSIRLWMRWNGTAENMTDHSINVPTFQCGNFNITKKFFGIPSGFEMWNIEGDFQLITNLSIYYGILNDFEAPKYILTLKSIL